MGDIYRYTVPKILHPTDEDWAGKTLSIMLHTIFTIAFICFLRIDEALKLQVHHITFSLHPELNLPVMTVKLDWHKTDQTGQSLYLLFIIN